MTPNDDELDRLLGALADEPLDDAFEPRLHAALVDASADIRAAAAARRRRLTRVALIVAATMVPAIGLAFYAAYRAANPPPPPPEAPAIQSDRAPEPPRERTRPRSVESAPFEPTPSPGRDPRPIERVAPSLERPFSIERDPGSESPRASVAPQVPPSIAPSVPAVAPNVAVPTVSPVAPDSPARPPIERLRVDLHHAGPPNDAPAPATHGAAHPTPQAPAPGHGAPGADPSAARRPPGETPRSSGREPPPDRAARPDSPMPLDRLPPPERPMPPDRPPPP